MSSHATSAPPGVAPTVSIALATFRGARHLEEQLASFLDQSRQPHEVIISDDASDDDTLEICRVFAREAPFRVRVLTSESNAGYVPNFERALAHCSGTYVFLSDQDDVWHANKIEVMLAELRAAKDAVLAIHDVRYCSADMTPTGGTKLQRIARLHDPERRYVTGMATVVRREFLQLGLPFPRLHGLTHDRWLHECAFAIGKKRVIDTVLADYRRHDDNVTRGSSVNSPARWAAWHALLEPLRQGAEPIDLKVKTWESVYAWLTANETALVDAGLADRDAIEAGKGRLASEIGMGRRRVRVLRSPRWHRLPAVLSLWWDGGYAPFSGAKSAFADLLRP